MTQDNDLEEDEERGGKKPSVHGAATSGHHFIRAKQNLAPIRSATSLAEERSLIHEVVQHAHLALQGQLDDLLDAAEQLEQL